MKIVSVSFRNFGPYGNKLMSLELSDVPSFYLVYGANGTGKSNLSDIIKFAIYGKLENKKLKDIPNRLNKNAYTKVELMTKKGKVIIERGVEPSIFNLWVNPKTPQDKPFDKAGKRSVQEYLEDEILEMPFYVFSNTLSLSIDDFKSFIKMSNADKKAIIDRIFGLQILNQMRELLKKQIKKINDGVSNITSSIEAYTNSLNSAKKEFDELENRIKQQNLDKKQQLFQHQDRYKQYITKCSSNIIKINTKINEILTGKKLISESIFQERQLLMSSQNKINLYMNSKCPTCESDLRTEFHQEILKHCETAIDEINERLKEKNEKFDIVVNNHNKLEALRYNTEIQTDNARIKLGDIERELNKLNDPSDDLQISSLKKIMDDSQKNIDDNKQRQIKSKKGVAFYGLVEEILGDKGVKQLAIKTIIPSLNVEIARMLKSLEIEHRVVFDEEFDARITHFGMEVSPETLSTGETKKVDFAVLLAIIRLMKMKFPYLNMLFLDEIFASIDPLGQQQIINILKDTIRDYNMNIFVINHYPLSHTEFDYKISINKINGFSTYEIEKTV